MALAVARVAFGQPITPSRSPEPAARRAPPLALLHMAHGPSTQQQQMAAPHPLLDFSAPLNLPALEETVALTYGAGTDEQVWASAHERSLLAGSSLGGPS